MFKFALVFSSVWHQFCEPRAVLVQYLTHHHSASHGVSLSLGVGGEFCVTLVFKNRHLKCCKMPRFPGWKTFFGAFVLLLPCLDHVEACVHAFKIIFSVLCGMPYHKHLLRLPLNDVYLQCMLSKMFLDILKRFVQANLLLL